MTGKASALNIIVTVLILSLAEQHQNFSTNNSIAIIMIYTMYTLYKQLYGVKDNTGFTIFRPARMLWQNCFKKRWATLHLWD